MKEKLEEAEIKKASAEAIADNVMREKKTVESESAKAAVEKEKVDKIQAEVAEVAFQRSPLVSVHCRNKPHSVLHP